MFFFFVSICLFFFSLLPTSIYALQNSANLPIFGCIYESSISHSDNRLRGFTSSVRFARLQSVPNQVFYFTYSLQFSAALLLLGTLQFVGVPNPNLGFSTPPLGSCTTLLWFANGILMFTILGIYFISD